MTSLAAAAYRRTDSERRVCVTAEQLLVALVAQGYPVALEPQVAALRVSLTDMRDAKAEFRRAIDAAANARMEVAA